MPVPAAPEAQSRPLSPSAGPRLLDRTQVIVHGCHDRSPMIDPGAARRTHVSATTTRRDPASWR